MAEAVREPMFLTNLECELVREGDNVWKLTGDLVYFSRICGLVVVPRGFETDFASVPRIPIVYLLWGGRAHREGVVHDYLFRKGCSPEVSFETANRVFLEAMESRGKPVYVRYPIYWGVCVFSRPFFKRLHVEDRL